MAEENIVFQNYHKHTHHTNPIISDSCTTNEQYAKRASELGHGIISIMEHGWQGRYIEGYELAQKYNLKFVFGVEAYWVKDRFEKDNSNCHIYIGAKNENGRQSINSILSEANLTGYYYRPRIDLPLILSLPHDDVIITSACVAGWRYEDAEEIFLQFKKYFGDNFFLEVQYHNTITQKKLNQRIAKLSEKYNIPIMMGCDSHYINSDSNKERDDFILSKGIKYDDEDGWFLDYPDGKTAQRRFIEQGILTKKQIYEAINNTNIFLEVEEYDNPCFSNEIKMPILPKYQNKTQEERNKIFLDIINTEWEKEKQSIDRSKWELYEKEIKKETDIVITTNHADYFLVDYEVVKTGKKNKGYITPSGRGCFTKDALVHTEKTLKTIDSVDIGDKVISADGLFHKVLNKFEYNIDEELIKIRHYYGTDILYPTICTKDHKILIYRNSKHKWIKAEDIIASDYVCVPKIKNEQNENIVIDLNLYNEFGYEYDNDYIYEYIPCKNNYYKYSPSDIARHIGVGASIVEKFANGEQNLFSRKKNKLKELFNYIPYNSQEEYCSFIKEKRTRKISRFITVDKSFNEFVGLMYGDGFTCKQRGSIGLAINPTTNKDYYNRNIFLSIANNVGADFYENRNKNKDLSQLYMNSIVFSNFIKKELFVSNKNTIKEFNHKWIYQNNVCLEGLLNGLINSDGHIEDARINFDNTSLSLINAFKIMSLKTNSGICGLSIRPKHYKNNCHNKESYKLRRTNSKKFIKEDENFYYIKIKSIELLPKQKTIVYDLCVEDSHNYLINNMIVHNSAVSFYINKLLGLTMVDRISSDIKMFPERFMSAERILKAKTLADIDLNLGNVKVFADAQSEVLGDGHSYPMIAYGTLKPKAAWKMYAKSQNISFDIANNVSEQIEKYNRAIKHAETEEDREDINVIDYIDKKYHTIYEQSTPYQGVIDSFSIHPCSFLLYNGDIKKEIGLIKIKDNICCIMDGHWAEKYNFLKNDLLKVSVVELIYKVFERINIPIIEVLDLLKICTPENNVWDIYKKSCTIGINQVEQNGTKTRVAKYAPTNISELSAFVAAIRPGFKTMYKIFENRESFKYGIDTLDKLIQTPQMPQSFILYQEMQMNVLNYAGIPMSECYEIIKNIAKKRSEKVFKYKDVFMSGFSQKIISEENETEENAKIMTDKIWQILEDSAAYIFNASHSYCVAIDSLYGAYLKTNYPLYFYEVLLNMLEEKGDKERLSLTKMEASSYFNIRFPAVKFRQDNRHIVADEKTNSINLSLQSIKMLSSSAAEDLYKLKNNTYNSFTELLYDIKKSTINSRQLDILIKLDYFSEFGNSRELLKIVDIMEFFDFGESKQIKKEKLQNEVIYNIVSKYSTCLNKQRKELKSFKILDCHSILKECEQYIKTLNIQDFDFINKIANQKEYLGYIQTTGREEDRSILSVQNIYPLHRKKDGKHFGYSIVTQSIGSGIQSRFTIFNRDYDENNPIKKDSLIQCISYSRDNSYFILNKYQIVI